MSTAKVGSTPRTEKRTPGEIPKNFSESFVTSISSGTAKTDGKKANDKIIHKSIFFIKKPPSENYRNKLSNQKKFTPSKAKSLSNNLTDEGYENATYFTLYVSGAPR